MSGCLELLHRYVFDYYSHLNKQIYIYCTFSWSTKSMQYLPRGFMSFKMSAIIISIPLDSWVAMQVCKIREGSWRQGAMEGRRGERGTQDGQREGEREYAHQQIPQRTPPQNLKDLVTAMNLPAKAEQPENRPQEVPEETCVVHN